MRAIRAVMPGSAQSAAKAGWDVGAAIAERKEMRSTHQAPRRARRAAERRIAHAEPIRTPKPRPSHPLRRTRRPTPALNSAMVAITARNGVVNSARLASRSKTVAAANTLNTTVDTAPASNAPRSPGGHGRHTALFVKLHRHAPFTPRGPARSRGWQGLLASTRPSTTARMAVRRTSIPSRLRDPLIAMETPTTVR